MARPLRRKRKTKPKPKKAVGCAPLRKKAPKRKRSRKTASKATKAVASRSAARGSSAGGGADATAAARRRAAKKRDAPARCTAASTKRRKAKAKKKPAVRAPAPAASPVVAPSAPAAVAVAPAPVADPAPTTLPQPPAGQPGFGRREAQRLLWRAGCGPRPGDVDRLVAMGRDAAIEHVLDPGTNTLDGPAPTVGGAALRPYDAWGHDHLQFLHGLVSGTHGLRWRMALVWHDWFACSANKAPRHLMIRQTSRLWELALGSFDDLAREITIDPAMLDFLDGLRNARSNPNENFAREFFELFTLGANRGAYTEQDIREAARALTGWTATWNGTTFVDFRFDPARHDTGQKTIFGQAGAFRWDDVVRLALEHPQHASWFVTRLWRAFVGEPADAATQARLERVYVDGGRQVLPVLREILRHPRFFDGPAMVVPPAVLNAGLLRAVGRGIDTDVWAWIADMCGQVLLRPPNVSGWREEAWLGSATFDGRWTMATYVLRPTAVDPSQPYDATETAAVALQRALAHLGGPVLTPETRDALLRFADDLCPPSLPTWQRSRMRAQRQNALRMLVATSSDLACC